MSNRSATGGTDRSRDGGPWFWPVHAEDDPRWARLIAARSETIDWGQDPAAAVEATGPVADKIAVITCFTTPRGYRTEKRNHPPGQQPPLGELWSTSYGPLFRSLLVGRIGDPPDWHFGTTPQPLATMPEQQRSMYVDYGAEGWDRRDLTLTEVLVLVGQGRDDELWVKCPDHGSHQIDPSRLLHAAQDARRHRTHKRHTTALQLEQVIRL